MGRACFERQEIQVSEQLEVREIEHKLPEQTELSNNYPNKVSYLLASDSLIAVL